MAARRRADRGCSVANLQFANADAQGEAQASWRTSDPATSRGAARFPGVLDLQGQLSRADGTRVFRYLPLDMPQGARATTCATRCTHGIASRRDVPGARATCTTCPSPTRKHGEFRIAAQVRDVTYAYVPREPRAASRAPGRR